MLRHFGGAIEPPAPLVKWTLRLSFIRLRVIVHDFNGDAVQVRGKTSVVSVQAQIISVDARQPNQCASFNDNLALVTLLIREYGCGFGTEDVDVIVQQIILLHLG